MLYRLSCYQWAQLSYEAARKMISFLRLTTILGRLIATISVLCFFGEACKIVAFYNNMLTGVFIAQALLLKHHEYNLSIIYKRQKSQRKLCGSLILSLSVSFFCDDPWALYEGIMIQIHPLHPCTPLSVFLCFLISCVFLQCCPF